jgi:hypothetical protein
MVMHSVMMLQMKTQNFAKIAQESLDTLEPSYHPPHSLVFTGTQTEQFVQCHVTIKMTCASEMLMKIAKIAINLLQLGLPFYFWLSSFLWGK